MIWEMIGAIGEWIAAIAVIASLLYLARQIKLANLQSEAVARYSFWPLLEILSGHSSRIDIPAVFLIH